MRRPFGRFFFLLQLALFLLPGAYSPGMAAAEPGSLVPREERIADFEARLLLARLLAMENDRLGEAEKEYRRLVKEAGQDVTVRQELADLLLRMGKPEEAMAQLEAAFKIAPADEDLRRAMAGVETRRGHLAQAQKIMTGLCGGKTSAPATLSCAGLLLSWGDFYEAEASTRRYLADHSDDLAGRLMLADALVGSQRFSEAEGIIQLLLLDFPTMPELYVRLATIRILAKDFPAALQGIAEAPDNLASTPSLLMAAGQANLEAGRYEEAERFFTKVANMPSPLHDDALLGLARVYRNVGRENECEPLLRDLLTQSPDRIEAQYLSAGLKRVASPPFLNALCQAPTSTPEFLSQWAHLYATDGLNANALACYDAALTRDRDFFPARLERAQLLGIMGQYNAALAELDDLANTFSTNPKVLLTRGRVLAWAKHYEEAIIAYDGLIALNPADPTLRREQARTAIWGKDMAAATRIYPALWSEPVDTQLIAALADFPAMRAEVQKKDDSTLPWDGYETFSQLLAPVPGSSLAQEHKRMERIRLGLLPVYRVQKSAFLEKQAKELSWDNRFARAMDSSAELIALEPGNQEARFDHAQAKCALGLCDGAGKAYEELLAISPLHNLASLALARQQRQNNPALAVEHSFWQERGRGDLADMDRQQTDLTFALPLFCRFKLEAIGHRWHEAAGNTDPVDANGFGLRISGVANQYLRGSFELHQKHYEEDGLADITSGGGELWFNLDDTLRLGLGLERRDELANRFGLAQGIQTDHWWIGLVAPLSRRLELAGRTETLDYNDGNRGKMSSLSLGYAFTDHPRLFKVSLKGESRDTRSQNIYLYQGAQLTDIIHPYWTPENYTAGTLEFEWLHDLSLRQFCGTEQHTYGLKLGLVTDSENNPALRLEGKYLYEFAEHWRLELKGLVHSSQEWDATAISAGIQYRF